MLTSLTTGRVTTRFARAAKASVDRVSSSCVDEGETQATIAVRALPPREFASKRVSLLSRYGTCMPTDGVAAPESLLLPPGTGVASPPAPRSLSFTSVDITLPNVSSDLLMEAPSFRLQGKVVI
jgi:hypothetical protein